MLSKAIARFERFVTNITDVRRMFYMFSLDMLNHVTLVLAGVVADVTGPVTRHLTNSRLDFGLPGNYLCNGH